MVVDYIKCLIISDLSLKCSRHSVTHGKVYIFSFCFCFTGLRPQQGQQQPPNQPQQSRNQQIFFKSPLRPDLSSSYANNFKNEGSASMQTIESILINTMFKRLISSMTEKVTWLKSPENIGLNNDCRSLIHYVKLNHGNVFRRVVLSGMMESTKKLVKTQYKVEGNQIVRYA